MLKRLHWTPELGRGFWSELADTDYVQATSFGNLAGPFLLEFIRPFLKPHGSHLDFGAGDGYMVGTLLRAGYATAAFEPSARANRLTENFGEHPLYLGTLSTDVDRKFDVIIFSEVIEHLFDEDFPLVFSAIQRMLADDGTLIVTTPNAEDLDTSSVYCPTCKHLFHPWQHVRRFTEESLTETLASFGFAPRLVHQYDFREAPSAVIARRHKTRDAEEVYDAVTNALSNPAAGAKMHETLRTLLTNQAARQTSFADEVTRTKLKLGDCTRLIFIGARAAARAAGKPAESVIAVDQGQRIAECVSLHERMLQTYTNFLAGHRNLITVYTQGVEGLLRAAAHARPKWSLYLQLRKLLPPVNRLAAQAHNELEQFSHVLGALPVRKHDVLLPMHNRALRVAADHAEAAPVNGSLFRLVGTALETHAQGYPRLQGLLRRMVSDDSCLWASTITAFEDHVAALRSAMQLAPSENIAMVMRRNQEIDQREHALAEKERHFNKLFMVRLVRKLGLLKCA